MPELEEKVRVLNISKKAILNFVMLAGLCAWGVMLYAQTLSAPFVFDDETTVLKNTAIHKLASPALWRNAHFYKRFVAMYSFALNYRFNGLDVRGYHAVNLAIHLATAIFVVWFILLLLKTPRMREESIAQHARMIAFLGGLFFVSHPIETEAVTYICQRFECLATLFYMLALCGYLKWRMSGDHPSQRAVFFMLSVVAALLGMLTKEIVFTLPLCVALIEGIFFRMPVSGSSSWGDRPVLKMLGLSAGLLLLSVLLVGVLLPVDLPKVFSSHAAMGISSGTYLLTQFRVIVKYVGLLFFPVGQNLDYDLAWSTSLFDGVTLPCALGLLLLILLGIRSLRRFPLIGFGIFWFFLTLSVSSSFIPQTDALFEHRLYLPSVGFVIAFLAGLYALIKNFHGFLLFMGGIILCFSALTYERNALWTEDVRLWEDVVTKSPHKVRPYTNLGLAYRKHGEYAKALGAYEAALRLSPGKGKPLARIYTNLGAVYGAMGRYPEEIDLCLKAIAEDPRNYQAYSNLGLACALTGDYKKALEYGWKAVKMNNNFDEAWNNLGVTQALMGNYKRAGELFQKALKCNPYYAEAAANLRLARERMKQPKKK